METALLDTIPVNSNATPEARELLQYHHLSQWQQ